MRQTQENKYSMYLSTLAELDANSTEVATVPALGDSIAAFRAVVTQITATTQAQ